MKEFTLIFIFTEDYKNVLMCKKTHGYNIGCWNGVGGHIEENETSDDCAYRELWEETHINKSMLINPLVKICINIPSEDIKLHVYGGNIRNGFNFTQVEEEELMWIPVSDVVLPRCTNWLFAGIGELQYFVHAYINLKQNTYCVTYWN